MTYELAFTALADPTRRAIVEALRDTPLPVGRLARTLPVSRPAVSQHLKILSDAGLAVAEPKGAARIYALAPEGWAAMRDYLDTMWDDALSAYAHAAETLSKGET